MTNSSNLSVSTGEIFGYIEKSNLPLKKHQKILVKHMRENRGLIAIHATGSGKTLSSVVASQAYLYDNPDGNIIVITPTSLQQNFKKEMIQYDADINFSKYSFYTYESFARAKKSKKIKCKKIMMIIDEAHNLRTEIVKSKINRASLILECAENADKVLLLTATPIVNEPYDIANLIAIVNGKEPISKFQFKNMLSDLCRGNNEAFKKFFKCQISMFEPNSSETKEFYPDIEIIEEFIKMPKTYEQKYKKVEEGSEDIQYLYKNPTVFYNGVRRASNKLDNVNKSPKIIWIKKFLTEHKTGKIIFFSNWLDSGINIIKNTLDEYNVPYSYIDGSQTIKKRKESVEMYNKDIIRVLIISRAGGEGLDLKGTRYMILLEPAWNPSITEQVIGRGVRFKSHYHLPISERKVEVYKLYLIKNEEKSILNSKNINNNKGLAYYDNIKNFFKNRDKKWSVDLYLRALCMRKKQEIQEILQLIKPLSIEQRKC